ncbi:hypothetical protein [Nocardioides sp.]|jgi:hypothetical protein|uniref:hypothetical protein n=1 Tax=Nocardioides sp. TaxID=35761 RepID=UPI0031FEE85D|nr:hypothetical protein [Nocardioides sp.]
MFPGIFTAPERAPEPAAAGDWLTTPYEDWCEGHGLRPEERGAWDLYEFLTGA